MEKLQTRDTWEYLLKQGYKLTKEDWETLNVEGSLRIENFDLAHVNFINKNTKVTATAKGIYVCAS